MRKVYFLLNYFNDLKFDIAFAVVNEMKWSV
ncbi:hypothetical protein SAMN06297280_1796 [Arsukibacterium tuosuense]|uniref:Uncharacterized protein n=1 Tax=Arsukibacterium tuosuense TaxID=1323745 RepID=A0A285ITD3_9GAMM|nr:hypothetical protein SAMN06297280_1796 [Arsukibacterium tuosuense]